ncbi:MAG: hypothetical protein ACOC2M_00510 [bacterium]
MAITMLLLLSIMAQGVTVGQTFSQKQVDSWSVETIKNNLDIWLSNNGSPTIQNGYLVYEIQYYGVEPVLVEFGAAPDADYWVVKRSLPVKFRVERVKACINQYSVSTCIKQWIKPKIIKNAKAAWWGEIETIKRYQTTADLADTLDTAITKEELN